jgi:hypothetical protein
VGEGAADLSDGLAIVSAEVGDGLACPGRTGQGNPGPACRSAT